jgi:hypothetical protein
METSTIEVPGATNLIIDVQKFEYDAGVTSVWSQQILKIYRGTGLTKTLVGTYQRSTLALQKFNIPGNSATIEWQAGQGMHGGFSLAYSSDGTSTGNNFSCHNFVARQGGVPPVVPVTPSSLSLQSVNSTTAVLKWTDNSDNESWFEIERKGPDNYALIQTFKSNSNTITFSDGSLQANSTYSYSIRAFNTLSGYSAASNSIEVKTPAPPPVTPSALTLKSVTYNSASLQWTDNSNSESWFEIERRGPNSNTTVQKLQSNANTTTYIDNGLQSSSTYTYTIRAYNSITGYSSYSNTVTVVTTIPPPAAPSVLTSSAVTFTSATLRWTDNSGNENWFEIERRGPNSTTVIQNIKCDANITSYTDQGLQVNATYLYSIRAYNSTSGYSTYSNSIQILTPYAALPNAPSKLQSKDYTNESITIRWNDNSVDENGFLITRTLATDNTKSTTIQVNANDTIFTDTGLESSITYVYSVKAVNVAGSSASSNINVASTLSYAETKRVKDNLIAYYNFSYDPGNYIHDLSGYGEPLNLKINQPSAVSWNVKKKLEIISNVEIVSTLPAKKITDAIKNTGELTFECWIKPNEPNYINTSRILSMGIDNSEIGFVLDQKYDISAEAKAIKYSVRLQTESTNEAGYPELTDDKDITYINLQHIAYTRNNKGEEILYVNGKKAMEGYRPSGLNSWSDNFYLRFGNEKGLNQAWQGILYSVALYNKALSQNQISQNFTVGPCDSLSKTDLKLDVSIYPNPVKDYTTIEIIPLEIKERAPVTIIRIADSYGTIRSEEALFNPNERFVKTFDFRSFPAGIYFLQVISGDNKQTSKFVIQ